MPIDGCIHTFEQLSKTVLPAYFSKLESAIENPISAQKFVGFKSATKQALKNVDREVDFPGCYVFLEGSTAIYVGISRSLIKRLTQHLNQVSHYSASLAYRMASEEYPHALRRDQAMKDEQFRRVFVEKQEQLQNTNVAYVEIPNDLELYLFEVYATMRLDTDVWNTFRTH